MLSDEGVKDADEGLFSGFVELFERLHRRTRRTFANFVSSKAFR